MSKRAEEKVNCFLGGCPSARLSLHCTLAGGVGDPEVVPFWNSLIIKILCDKSNLFIYFQEQYFVRHSGTAFLRFPVATSPCTLHLCILAVSSAIVQVLCRRRRSTSDWCTYSVCCPCLSSSLPRSHICPGRHDGVDCEVKTGIQVNNKVQRSFVVQPLATGRLNCPVVALTINCIAVTRNIIISFRIYFCIIIPPTKADTRTGRPWVVCNYFNWMVVVDLGKSPSIGQAQEERKVQRERARTWMCRPRSGNSWWCQELRIYLRSRWGCLFRIGQILCIPVEFHLHSVVESGVCRFIWRDEEEMNE